MRSAGAITLDATDRGQYRPTGLHEPDNLNYLAGDCRFPISQAGNCFAGFDDFRNFFVFDLSGVTDLITAATRFPA